MQKILKSFVTLGAVATMMVSATGAYFTSTVTAEDNVITTGTLLLAVDSSQEDTYVGTWSIPNAYEVVRENTDGTVTQSNYFIPWTGAAPADNHTYTVGVRNNGSLPLNFRAAATGSWASGPRFGTTLPDSTVCPAVGSTNASLVSVSNVHLYAATPSSGCESAIGCRNLRDGLQTGPWTPVAGLTAGNFGPVSGVYLGTTDGSSQASPLIELGPGEFAVYQVTTTLDSATNNCYQGATYNFDFTVQGKQVGAPTW